MSKVSLPYKILIVLFGLIVASAVQAQATRTWVSGVGDDANPCSRTAPCKTFAGAISKTAPFGEINVLDPGGFGAVTITKSITIDGSPGVIAGVLVSGTNGIVVASTASTDVVVLRNLDINGLGTGLSGISMLGGGTLHVENCRIYGFKTGTASGINFMPSTATASVAALYVKDTKVFGNNAGILIKPTSPTTTSATLTNVLVQANVSGFGIRAEGGSAVVISNSAVNGNSGQGIIATSSDARPVSMNIDHTISSNNLNWGVFAGATSTVYMSNMQITGNGGNATASGAGSSLNSFNNNYSAGNTSTGTAPTIIPSL